MSAAPAITPPSAGCSRGSGAKSRSTSPRKTSSRSRPNLVQDLIVTFDDRIYPRHGHAEFGAARDVDGDGRFTILLSSWLDHLGGGRYPVDGFVRVADLDPAFRSPFGNQCDMMYLSTALKAGPHLRTVLAHEYMHAVIFSQKTLQGPARRPTRHWKRKDGSTRRWPISPKTCTAFRRRTSTIASVRS